jgi:hypothetical protein
MISTNTVMQGRFYRSISLFEGLTPTKSANNYYYLSPFQYWQKLQSTEASLNKALSIYNRLNMAPDDDLINLQGIIYKANGNYNSAAYCLIRLYLNPDSN